MVSNIFYFHPYLRKWSKLTNIFQFCWNHQLVIMILHALTFRRNPEWMKESSSTFKPVPSLNPKLDGDVTPFCTQLFGTPTWRCWIVYVIISLFFWGVQCTFVYVLCVFNNHVPCLSKNKIQPKWALPGDSIRDLFIPDRWRSLNHFKGSRNFTIR